MTSPNTSTALAKATLVAADKLGLTAPELAEALNASATTVTGLRDILQIDSTSPSGERAKLLVRLSVALAQLCGDDLGWMRHFMKTPNKVTGGVPAQQISSTDGLTSILQFAESLARRSS